MAFTAGVASACNERGMIARTWLGGIAISPLLCVNRSEVDEIE